MLKEKGSKQVRKTVILITVMSLSFIFFQTLGAWADFQKAPVNPKFIEWQAQQKIAQKTGFVKQNKNIALNQNRLRGLTPSPLDFSHLKKNVRKAKAGETFPATYDLRTLNKLTPVREQAPYGTCWAFATMATLESYLMPGQVLDFSEKQLAYIAYSGSDSFTTNPISPQETSLILDQGGNMWKATAILARWSSPVSEADVPYGNDSPFPVFPPIKHIQQSYYLPNFSKAGHEQFLSDNIKSAVMNYGAVSIGMHWDGDPQFFNENNNAYYYNGEDSSNHEVNIVGWNDTFPKENFSILPPGNGAWIVRNSWGPNWGDSGYFYISYFDTQLDDGVALDAEDVNNYDNIYQYDPLGWITSFGNGDTAMYANIFTANSDETLKAVSFYVPTDNVTYHIYSYTDCLVGNPKSGVEAMSPQDGILNITGYHTIALVNPVSLKKGQTFSVVIYIETPGYNYPIPIETIEENYSEKARAQAGQSYISLDLGNTWTDLTTIEDYEQANVCLKAFTSKATSSDCLSIEGNYSLQIPCAEYGGINYSFTLNSTDLINWTMDFSTFKTVSRQDNCLTIAGNLNFEIYCAAYYGAKYGFNLIYVNDLNWSLDMKSLHQVE